MDPAQEVTALPRIVLEPLPRYPFRTGITVRTTDLNYGGHLGNDRLLALIQEARVAWLADRGWTELDCAGVALIMADAAVVFQGEAFAGDRLLVEVGAGEASRCSFRLFYRLTRPDDGAAIALVETGMACFDYGERRIRPLPGPVAAACLETGPGDAAR